MRISTATPGSELSSATPITGEVSTYGTVTADVAYVVNSLDGHAEPAVNDTFDLSENEVDDFLDVRAGHLTTDRAEREQAGGRLLLRLHTDY